MIIVGAGLAGLIAGHAFPNAKIVERRPGPGQLHGALLRFRSDAVSLITGIPFRKVLVRKGIWDGERFRSPDIQLANAYSLKCTGRALNRSVWDISSAERWVAPKNLYARMIEACGARIEWGADAMGDISGSPTISTAPLHANATWFLGFNGKGEFHRAPIHVARWRLSGADVHQTIYFPSEATSTYRASITGDTLIHESMDEPNAMNLDALLRVFGLRGVDAEDLGGVSQSYGKIAPIEERLRKELIHRLTTEANLYSVGRFATWRNILLDDVVKDLRVVRSMIEQSDTYSRRLRSL